MMGDLRELWRFRELLLAMVERELKIRYKNSVLGFFWSLLTPLATVLVMTLVFGLFLNNKTPNYSAYVLSGYLPFVYINVAMLDSAQSVLAALPVVKKVYFPREILPLASVLANFVHLLLSFAVFFCYLFVVWAATGFAQSPFTWKILFLPLLLVIVLVFTIGASLIISALNVFYEDIKYIVSVMLYLLFFLTPVMYFSENVWHASERITGGPTLYFLYHLNPLAAIATTFKKTLVPSGPIDIGLGQMVDPLPMNWWLFAITVVVAFAMLIGGYSLFNRMKWRFVERP